jgi:hypothetical protein
MELQGKLIVIGDTQIFGTNGFAKREVVVETTEQYPQKIQVEFVQDKCNLLETFSIGQDVKIGINLRGREWANPQGEIKYFNTIQGWKIENGSAAAQATLKPASTPAAQPAPPAYVAATDVSDEEYDDLPF